MVEDALAAFLDVGERRPADRGSFGDFPLGESSRTPGAGESLAKFPVGRFDLIIRPFVIHTNILVSACDPGQRCIPSSAVLDRVTRR